MKRPPTSPPNGAANAADARRRVAERLWKDHQKQLHRARLRPASGRVHDLRIGTRRLLAHLEIVSLLSSSGPSRRVRRRLKRLLDATGPARDAHVQLRLFERLFPREPHPGGRQFHRTLKARERRLTRKLGEKLKRHASKLRRTKPRHLFRPLKEKGSCVGAARRQALQRAIRRVLERRRTTGRDLTRNRHRLRVALKKLRYLAEIMSSATPATVGRLRDIQASLGECHDFDLLLEHLHEYAARHPATEVWLQARTSRLRQYQRRLQPQSCLRVSEIRAIG